MAANPETMLRDAELQFKLALESAVPDRFKHLNDDFRNAAWIARLIRNAFAHAPFNPSWQFYPECRNRVFEVRDTIRLDTAGIEGAFVERRHYGGPLAVLRLSQFVRERVLIAQSAGVDDPANRESISR